MVNGINHLYGIRFLISKRTNNLFPKNRIARDNKTEKNDLILIFYSLFVPSSMHKNIIIERT